DLALGEGRIGDDTGGRTRAGPIEPLTCGADAARMRRPLRPARVADVMYRQDDGVNTPQGRGVRRRVKDVEWRASSGDRQAGETPSKICRNDRRSGAMRKPGWNGRTANGDQVDRRRDREERLRQLRDVAPYAPRWRVEPRAIDRDPHQLRGTLAAHPACLYVNAGWAA